MPYMSTINVDRTTSSFLAGAIPVTSVFGRLGFGWLGDKFNKKWITTASIMLTGFCLFLFNYAATAGLWLFIPLIILLGFGYGGPVPMMPAMLREYFGRARLGSVIGFGHGVTLIGMIGGAPFTGWIFDRFGSYQIAWYVLTGIAILGAICVMTTPSKSSPDT